MVNSQTMMVMKRTVNQAVDGHRLSVAEAKAHLSAALRTVDAGPTVIHRRGRDAAVLLGIDAYERLVADAGGAAEPTVAFLRDVAALKQRLGGGVELEVERATLVARDPFARSRR